MSQIVDKQHKQMAGRMKNVMATYNEAEDLINIGAYKSGSNKNIDYAIYKIDTVNKFLMQQTDEKFDYDDEISQLSDILQIMKHLKMELFSLRGNGGMNG